MIFLLKEFIKNEDECIEAGLIEQNFDKLLFFSLETEEDSLYFLNNGTLIKHFLKNI